MKLIVITSPGFVPEEAFWICHLLDTGVDTIHLRKPQAAKDEYKRLIDSIPPIYHGRIVIHDYFDLYNDYGLKGIHLNSRNHEIPEGYNGSISCSCHSLDEVARRKSTMDYVFLSPIFDSISKKGYQSGFSLSDLQKAALEKIIDDKVIALGGVTLEHLILLKSLSFGGAAILGDVWQRIAEQSVPDVDNYIHSLRKISNL